MNDKKTMNEENSKILENVKNQFLQTFRRDLIVDSVIDYLDDNVFEF